MTILEKAAIASRELPKVVPNKINRILNEIADEIVERAELIVAANAIDLAALPADDTRYGQIIFNHASIDNAAEELRNIAALPSALGKILSSTRRSNEMVVNKVTTPFGVVGVVYEWQPTVALDSFSLCFKSGNALVLNCQRQFNNTTTAIVEVIKEVLDDNGINPDAITLLDGEPQSTLQILHSIDHIDLVIARGSNLLNEFVRDNARVPIITTFTGVSHTYIDIEACPDKAALIVLNAKTCQPDACGSLDCVVIHDSQLATLEATCQPLALHNVTIYADEQSYSMLEANYPYLEKATQEHFSTEFRGNKMAIKTVSSIDEALLHIACHSAKHSEAIVTESCDAAKRFTSEVDAAFVCHNASTAFADAAQLGISTQKLGARGAISLSELTTYKYIVTGD